MKVPVESDAGDFMRKSIRISEHARKIAHRLKNGHVVRVVYEEDDAVSVITVYPARRERYEEV